MKILIVEDELHVVARLKERLDRLRPSIDIIIARSRSGGIAALHCHEFDFIVCDLRLPPKDGGVDTDEAHGLAVHAEAKKVCPGTPCLFFTGYDTSSTVREQLSSGGTQDVLGTGEHYGMTRLLPKDEFVACVERLKDFNSELARLDSIDIELSDGKCGLDQAEERALRLLARSLQGTRVSASNLGGLSGSRNLRIRVQDSQGRVLGSYFAKIDLRNRLTKERRNYHRHVSPLLRLGHYPSLGRDIEAGIGKREALFYQLADGYTKSLFDVLNVNEGDAMAVVGALREIFAPWMAVSQRDIVRVSDLRVRRIDNSALEPHRKALGSTEVFEAMEQQFTICSQHGDLHGFNVLCDCSGGTVVIDFGNVGPAPACTDPTLLELSVLFHSDSPFRSHSWPTMEQLEAWFDLDEYLIGCPIPGFIRKCREWAIEAGGESDLPPVVYSEAVRQLKYEDTDHQRALAIARAAMREALRRDRGSRLRDVRPARQAKG